MVQLTNILQMLRSALRFLHVHPYFISQENYIIWSDPDGEQNLIFPPAPSPDNNLGPLVLI